MSNKPGYLYMYNPQTGQFEWVKQPIEGTPQPIENTTLSEFLGSFSGSDSFDLSNIVGSFGKSIGNMPTSQSSIGSTDNLQASWGIQDSIANNVRDKVSQREESLKNSFLDKATTRFGNTFSSDPLTAESAKNKMTDFLNGKSGSIKSGSSGMSKDPSAYMTAATDIAKFSSDIADSAKSKMSLPSQYNYNSNNVRDIYGHSQFFKSAEVPMSFAGKRPNFINSFTDVNKKLVKGAMDGYNISNNWIGALIGGVVGAGLGIGNTFAKLHTYNQNKYRIGRYNDINDRNYNLAQRDIQSNIWSTNNNIMNLQRTANIGALGGQIDNSEISGVTTFNVGGTHETNPNGGIPQGIGENGKPNLVEEGEVKWNDFIFSKRIKPQDDILKQYNSFFKGGVASYADAATKILNMHKERENNPFDIATLNVQMRRLADAQEYQKIAEEAAQYGLSPEEYVSLQQSLAAQNQTQDTNSFARGGDKGKKKHSNYTYMGTLELAQNSYKENANGNGAYLNLPGVGVDGSGLKGPNKQTKHFAKDFPTLAYHLSNFIRNDYLLQRIGQNVANATTEYTRELELDRYKTQEKRYNYCLKRAIHIISFLNAYDKKFLTNLSSRALNYLKGCGQHWNDTDFRSLKTMLNNPQITQYYFDKPHPSYLEAKLHGKDSFGAHDVDIVGNHSEFHITTTDELPEVITRSVNNQSSNIPNIVPQSNVTNTTSNGYQVSDYGRGSTGSSKSSSSVIYYDPQSVNSNGINGAYNTNGTGYKITGNGGGSGNKKYNGDIDYNDPANKPYRDKVYSLTDDDWNNVKQTLSERNPYYKDMDISQIKRLADDGQFGPVHEVVSNYNNPADDTVNQIVQTQLNDNDNDNDQNNTESTNTSITSADSTNDDNDNNNNNSNNNNDKSSSFWPLGLRTAPIWNNIRQILEQDAPDYTYSNQLKSLYRPSTYRPVGQYQRYQPVDQHYLDTQAQQQRNSLYGFYRNNAQSNAAANFLATMAAANTSHVVNQAYTTALQQNNQNRNAAIAANNQLDLQNEANRMNTERTNNTNYANIMGNAYAAAEQERLAVENATESNYNNLAENLSNLGREMYDRWRIDNDPTYSYNTNWDFQRIVPLVNELHDLLNDKRNSNLG